MPDYVLQEMIDESELQAEEISKQIEQLDDQIASLQEKISHIRTSMLDVIAEDLRVYLETVKLEQVSGYEVVFGPEYNVTNVTDWYIDSTSGEIIYEYDSTGWDYDPYIIKWVEDWNWGYDYLYHEPSSSGTYGLQPRLNQLLIAKNVQLGNKLKLAQSEEHMQDYATR
jgi:hypothetical protein